MINCFDGTYSKDQLKTWADKNILLCPVCLKPYEYCHGRVLSPYFRHKDKQECEYLYCEPETQEHIKGKQMLYEWISKQEGVSDVILEGWILETKQRPDIMFKHDNKQYVIEYQCSPISSQYLERHELYQAGGIKDIWILGTEKYFKPRNRSKVIQKNNHHHLDVHKKSFIYNYNSYYDLSSLYFSEGKILINAKPLANPVSKTTVINPNYIRTRKCQCKGIFTKVFDKLIECYPEAKLSNYHNNSIEIDAINLFLTLDYNKDLCRVEIKKRCFNKLNSKAWNGKKMANRSKWECVFKNIKMKDFQCSTIDSDAIVLFAMESINKCKGVELP